eukprot:6026855-Heterocapsa_arctica.AAC.1
MDDGQDNAGEQLPGADSSFLARPRDGNGVGAPGTPSNDSNRTPIPTAVGTPNLSDGSWGWSDEGQSEQEPEEQAPPGMKNTRDSNMNLPASSDEEEDQQCCNQHSWGLPLRANRQGKCSSGEPNQTGYA